MSAWVHSIHVVSVAYNVMTETHSDELDKGAVLLFEIATLYITYYLRGEYQLLKLNVFTQFRRNHKIPLPLLHERYFVLLQEIFLSLRPVSRNISLYLKVRTKKVLNILTS